MASTESVGRFDPTEKDIQDLDRLKLPIVFLRYIRRWALIAFAIITTGNWFFGLASFGAGISNGGRSALIWTFVAFFVAFAPINLSIAELASIAPTAGGQYIWVGIFASKRFRKILSYIIGWTTMLAYQAGNATGFIATGTIVQSIISLNNPNYISKQWQGFLLAAGNILLVYLINKFCTKWMLFYAQKIVLVLSLGLYLGYTISLFVFPPHATAAEVFFESSDTSGWNNLFEAGSVGQISAIAVLVGADAPVHMSEEVKDAAKNVPWAILVAYAYNLLTLPLLIAVCLAMKDVNAALDPSKNYGYPFIYVLLQAMSKRWATVVLVLTFLLFLCSNVNYFAASSRDTYAFARVCWNIFLRDNGVPFSEWLSKIDDEQHIPSNALLANAIISLLLTAIYIGSSTAFFAVASLNLVCLMAGYVLSIGSILWCRIKYPDSIPKGVPFAFGKTLGIIINSSAIFVAVWSFFWLFWPLQKIVTPANFNWAGPVFISVTLLCISWYFWKGKESYESRTMLLSHGDSSESAIDTQITKA